METKIIPFSSLHFQKQKHPPLTPGMIYALLIAIQKQDRKIPFGPADIKGSLTTLITRGHIIRKKIILIGRRESQWQVTKEAIDKLKKLGLPV
jgi:hypothetical protein